VSVTIEQATGLAPGFHPPETYPLIGRLHALLKKHVNELAAEAATIIGARGFQPWPEDASNRWLVHACRWQDQDIISQAGALADLCAAPGRPWAPAIVNACYSLMLPGARIEEHEGHTRELVRYHLPLISAADRNCFIAMTGHAGKPVSMPWSPGKGFIFNDTYPHWAQNGGRQARVVVIVDLLQAELGT
jgi:hypothetical protein